MQVAIICDGATAKATAVNAFHTGLVNEFFIDPIVFPT